MTNKAQLYLEKLVADLKSFRARLQGDALSEAQARIKSASVKERMAFDDRLKRLKQQSEKLEAKVQKAQADLKSKAQETQETAQDRWEDLQERLQEQWEALEEDWKSLFEKQEDEN